MLGSSVKTGSIQCWKKTEEEKKRGFQYEQMKMQVWWMMKKSGIHQTPNTIFTDDKVARAD